MEKKLPTWNAPTDLEDGGSLLQISKEDRRSE